MLITIIQNPGKFFTKTLAGVYLCCSLIKISKDTQQIHKGYDASILVICAGIQQLGVAVLLCNILTLF